jgi:NTE family protein
MTATAPTLRSALALWAAFLMTGPAQSIAQPLPPEPATVGIALSGGAARGLAHIGVLRVLEEAGIQPHAVTGTSMGSIIGGLYAVGYTISEIDSIARAIDWDALFDDPAMRPRLAPGEHLPRPTFFFALRLQRGRIGLPGGLVAGREIGLTLSRMFWPAGGETDFRELPVPFTTIATDLETGEAVVLNEGSLRRAIRASMSLPSIFEPTRWEDRLLIDGALVRNLPATEARQLGAQILICSDVTAPLSRADDLISLTDILAQAISLQIAVAVEEQRALCDLVIRIDETDLGGFTYARAAEWIALGEEAARSVLPELRRIAAAAAPAAPRRVLLRPDDPVRISRITVDAEDDATAARVQRIVDGPLPREITVGDAASLANEVRNAYRFSRVGYRLDAQEADTALVIEVEGRPGGELGMLFRYDDWYGGALLFAATFHDRVRFGSETHLDARLGEQLLLRGRYLQDGVLRVPYDLAAEARYHRAPLYEFEDGRRAAELRHVALGGWVYGGYRIDRATGVGLQLKAERNALRTAVAQDDSATAQTFYSISLLGRSSTVERALMPRQGGALLVRSEWARRAIGGGADFSHHLIDAGRALRIGEHTAVRGRLVLGSSHGDDLPVDRRFYLGGAYSGMVLPEVQIRFAALEPHERSGRALQLVELATYRRMLDYLVVGVHASAGNTFDEWRWWGVPEYLVGFGTTAAATTRFGDVQLDIAGLSLSARPRVSLQIGSVF